MRPLFLERCLAVRSRIPAHDVPDDRFPAPAHHRSRFKPLLKSPPAAARFSQKLPRPPTAKPRQYRPGGSVARRPDPEEGTAPWPTWTPQTSVTFQMLLGTCLPFVVGHRVRFSGGMLSRSGPVRCHPIAVVSSEVRGASVSPVTVFKQVRMIWYSSRPLLPESGTVSLPVPKRSVAASLVL